MKLKPESYIKHLGNHGLKIGGKHTKGEGLLNMEIGLPSVLG